MILTGSCSGASERTETFSLVFVSATVTMVLIKAQRLPKHKPLKCFPTSVRMTFRSSGLDFIYLSLFTTHLSFGGMINILHTFKPTS